jgi:hypothetical protein
MTIDATTRFITLMEWVEGRNGAGVLPVVKGESMKVIKGFQGLLDIYENLPKVGGFYVDKNYLCSKEFLRSANYYIPESEEEDEDMEFTHRTWLEYPLFKAIMLNKIENSPQADKDDLLEAVLYYLENDDFLD